MKNVEYHEDFSFTSRVGCGDCFLNFLCMLPHESTICGTKSQVHPQICVEAIDRTAGVDVVTCTPIARQCVGKRVPVKTDYWLTVHC
jgi:hypothetical protein